MISTIIVIFEHIIYTPDVPAKLGWTIAGSMFIGFLLVSNMRTLYKILIPLVVFAAFQEWFRLTMISSDAPAMSGFPTQVAVTITIFTMIIFACGLSAGTYLGIRARREIRATEDAGNFIIDKIENGGMHKGKEVVNEG